MILVLVPLWLGIASAEPCAAVHVSAVGFAEDAERKLAARAAEDIRERGVAVCADAPLSPTPECLAQVPCARDIVRGANAQWLVALDALRAGAAVQLTAQLFVSEGRREIDVDVARTPDQLASGGPVVPDEVLTALVRARDALAQEATRTPASPAPAADPTPPEPAPLTPSPAPGDASAEPPTDAIPPLALAGVVITGVGALVAVVGAATVVGQLGVIRDPASTGADKEQAAVLVPAMATVGLVGLVAAGAGAVLIGVGMSSAADAED